MLFRSQFNGAELLSLLRLAMVRSRVFYGDLVNLDALIFVLGICIKPLQSSAQFQLLLVRTLRRAQFPPLALRCFFEPKYVVLGLSTLWPFTRQYDDGPLLMLEGIAAEGWRDTKTTAQTELEHDKLPWLVPLFTWLFGLGEACVHSCSVSQTAEQYRKALTVDTDCVFARLLCVIPKQHTFVFSLARSADRVDLQPAANDN